jgi:hypothetical protein
MRISAMESLGFFDPPAASWSSNVGRTPSTDPDLESTQTTELFDIPVGRHTRNAEPTGELVRDIWDPTELYAPSLIDWAPQTASTVKLGRRNFRWPVVIGVTFAALIIAGLGYWIYQRPSSAADAAGSEVHTQALRLADALDRVVPLTDGLDAERLPETGQDSTVFFEVGEAARAVFAAASDLPASDATARNAAAEAAGLAIDVSRQLMDATAYRTALEPSLTLPLLETNPELSDLTMATAAFTEWRAGFETIHEALPDAGTGLTSTALDQLAGGMDATQASYLDAMREGDRAGAVEAIGELKAALSAIRVALLADMGEISTSVTSLVEETRARLDPLLG